MNRTSNARKQNSAIISHPSLLTSGLSQTARPVGWSLTVINAQDQVTSERGGPSPYRAVEPRLLFFIIIIRGIHLHVSTCTEAIIRLHTL
jgi:hypothetical protein